MNPYLIIGLIVFWLASLLGAEQYGDHARGVKDDLATAKEHLAIAKVIQTQSEENDALKTKLEVDHANSEAALNTLLSAPAPIVRVPHCASTGKVNSTPGSSVPATSPERAGDETQIAFDAFRQGLESDAAEWSRALNACKVVMDWAKAQ